MSIQSYNTMKIKVNTHRCFSLEHGVISVPRAAWNNSEETEPELGGEAHVAEEEEAEDDHEWVFEETAHRRHCGVVDVGAVNLGVRQHDTHHTRDEKRYDEARISARGEVVHEGVVLAWSNEEEERGDAENNPVVV